MAGDGTRALAGNFEDFVVTGELVEYGQQALWLGNLFVVEIAFDLQQHVVDAQAIVAHGAGQIGNVRSLPRQAFENVHQLRGRFVERVVEFRFVLSRAIFVLEGFFTQIGEAAVHVQIHALKIVQFGSQGKNPLGERRADFKRLRIGVFIELADVVGARAALVDLDLHEFRIAGLEDFAIGDLGAAGGRSVVRSGGRQC